MFNVIIFVSYVFINFYLSLFIQNRIILVFKNALFRFGIFNDLYSFQTFENPL